MNARLLKPEAGFLSLTSVMTASAVLPAEARLRRPVAIKKPGPSDRGAISLDSSFVLPVRRDVSTRLVQMNVLIDMIDPGDRDEVVMLAVGLALFRELDLVGAIEMVDLSNYFPV